jgi:hypothetical protein
MIPIADGSREICPALAAASLRGIRVMLEFIRILSARWHKPSHCLPTSDPNAGVLVDALH